jgi:single-stranded-DNA-specific exonuclease
MADLLQRRGVVGTEVVARYLAPALSALEDPQCIADVDKAVQRLLLARANQEPVVIYGDYDVDGVCSTSIMVAFLRAVDVKVDYYIPDRRAEGYGLNHAAVLDLASRYRLLVTVDCGITAVDEIAAAQAAGLDVIVVDHHQVPERLPNALACLNPHRLDCAYRFKDLCAAGVAFMLCAVLRRSMREQGLYGPQMPEPDMRTLLDLVTVATVADMVPLCETNRVLVAAGLKRMRQTMRPGLLALCQVAKVDVQRLSAADIGFRIGPRINARGRMSQAALAVDLMLAADVQTAQPMAESLDKANQERRDVERQCVQAALEQVEAQKRGDDAALVVADATWHPGVLGLVASRLLARYHRPVVVIGEGGKGSGRSVAGVDLHAALVTCAAHLLRFGGHPMAAGVTIDDAQIDAFRVALGQAVAKTLGPPPYAPELKPDLEVDCDGLDMAFLASLEQLAPFGQGNPEPLFAARDVLVHDKRLVGETHLKLRLGAARLDAIGFGLGTQLAAVPQRIDALFHLERNVFRGQQSLQMRLVDLRAAQPS